VIRVLIVDDSAVVRQSMKFILQSDRQLRVVGEASNGEEALALTRRLKPNVITMDIRMPRMDGLDAIQSIMAQCPTPILVVTSMDLERAGHISSRATRLGAVAVLQRPVSVADRGYQAFTTELIDQVKVMSGVRMVTRTRTTGALGPASIAPKAPVQPVKRPRTEVVGIGASTGGPAALHRLVGGLPANFPLPILIVQHISFGFVGGLAGWLDSACKLKVKVAQEREKILPGVIYVGPDDHHLEVTYGRVRLNSSAPVRSHRPSVTVLFDSLARTYGPRAMGVILTGMGADGASGLKALRNSGATTIAQDQASCVVFGMPKEAIALGAVQHVVPLHKIARTMAALCVH